jgi:hypothetical protein
MRSPSRSTFVLATAAIVLAGLTLIACCLAALDDAEFRVLEEQRGNLATSVCGVEVVQRAESKAHGVHASHAARHRAVIA